MITSKVDYKYSENIINSSGLLHLVKTIDLHLLDNLTHLNLSGKYDWYLKGCKLDEDIPSQLIESLKSNLTIKINTLILRGTYSFFI